MSNALQADGASAIPQVREEAQAGAEALDSTKDALADRIRALRLERGLSGRQVAQAIGVTSGYISQIELGVTTPSVSTLVKLAGALEVSVAELFESQQPPGRVLRREERSYVTIDALGSKSAYLARDARLSTVCVELEPEGEFTAPAPGLSGDPESVLVLSGPLIVLYDGGNYELASGDAVHFSNGGFYGCKNQSRSRAEFLWTAGSSS